MTARSLCAAEPTSPALSKLQCIEEALDRFDPRASEPQRVAAVLEINFFLLELGGLGG